MWCREVTASVFLSFPVYVDRRHIDSVMWRRFLSPALPPTSPSRPMGQRGRGVGRAEGVETAPRHGYGRHVLCMNGKGQERASNINRAV